MCEFVIDKHIAPGYGCCRCRTYQGFQRFKCRHCGVEHCDPITVPENTVAVYYEDGGSTRVKVLGVAADAKGVGFTLESIAPLTSSPIVNDIEAGETWTPWMIHGGGAYGGMWSLHGE